MKPVTENDTEIETNPVSNRTEMERFYEYEDKNELYVRWQNECTSLDKEGREKERQERQRSINVTFKCLHITIIAVEKQKVLHTLSVCLEPWLSSRKSACAVLYCHVWPAPLYYIFFPHCLTKGTIFNKTLLKHKM